MKLAVTISRLAEMDLTSQYRWYRENASIEVAERFLAAFDATVETLTRMPNLGRWRHFRAPELADVRSLAISGGFGSHLIFYRTTGESLSITRVVHGARDLDRRLLEPPKHDPDPSAKHGSIRKTL